LVGLERPRQGWGHGASRATDLTLAGASGPHTRPLATYAVTIDVNSQAESARARKILPIHASLVPRDRAVDKLKRIRKILPISPSLVRRDLRPIG
jgi:hypothetical protein